ncbi:hypothetical protein [Campylobacter gastrosuis]|uniref:Uncharacterized protein n=1 Tax=Campylobacter gastrosuis TaxID=2974576 RepID=A0ABT7HS18_9BACT|nr:hypothetical protein [Campylobacter gastrosuis]MDL0089194.1 hypothetical protein [Campylobacter gastrosuis]
MRILALIFVLFLFAKASEQKIDMHGGKAQNFGSFSQNFDKNGTGFKNFSYK